MKRTDDLLDVLRELSKTDKGITLINSEAEEKFISFRELWNRSYYVQELLKEHNVKKGNEVIMKCEDNEMFLYTLWGCIMGGFIAIPLDASKKNAGDTLLEHILESADNPIMVSDIYDDADGSVEVVKITDYYEKLTACGDTTDVEIASSPDDIIYVQYSSGTTDKPHGAIITKSNLTANTYGFIKQYSIDETERFLSWFPLTHCFGMVTFHLLPLMARAEHCLIATKLYMSQTLIWADLIDRYGATRISTIPFALKLFDNVYEKSEKNFNWNLSRVKSMFIGGEQINFALYKEFCDNVEQYGFGIEKVYPLYGLSEATVMVTANRMGKMAKTFHITNDKLMIGDVVECEEVKIADDMNNTFLEVGTVLETVQVSIRDDEFQELPEDYLGNIFVSGPSVTQGYYKDEEATRRLFTDDNWLSTGDVGFIHDGNLLIVGRVKELVVANGKKISCVMIEDMIQKLLADTPYHQCAVSNGIDRSNENEKVIAFIKTDRELSGNYELKQFAALKNKIRSTVFEKIGLTINEVVPVVEMPKTRSGKLIRRKLTEDYNAGVYREIVAKINGNFAEEEHAPVSAQIYNRHMIETKIVAYIEKNFHVKATNFDSPIFEYGIVSINIPSFIEALNKEFGVKMKAGDIFSYFTIRKLSGYIATLLNATEGETVQTEKKAESEKEKIAIVGMSCRFPGGANSIEEYWKLLVSGENGVSEVPEDRWELDKYYDEDKTAPGKMYCKKGGFLNCSIDEFDARFFNISPKEAMALDPQQRMLLELTWEAFENANMDIEKYNGSNTGVYVGICTNEYHLSQLYSGDLSNINAYSLTGSCLSTACGRISYTFGFEGPCVAVDTACSSSLTALHLACNALQAGDADMQVIAGINLMESPSTNIGFSKLQATSVDGYSKSFDASANGYGRGEGGGVLILKKLSAAIRDNNEILGIIRGSGMNQDGKSNGLTAPNGESQEKLIRKTMNDAGVTANDIDYVEMHGTGTKLGDPIEVGAVGATYGKNRKPGNLLKIGSVKSNIGHLEASAGVASIIKVLLCLKHKMIPANLHFHEPNPLIDWENANVEVIDKHTPWEKNGIRMAAINGFGFGGSNAHVIIEEYKQEQPEPVHAEKQDGLDFMLKITAQSESSLNILIQEYHDLLEKASDDKLEDIIYTANTGRADLNCRFVVCGKSRQMLIDRMETYLKDGFAEGVVSNVKTPNMMLKDRKAVFMFTGQGSQYVNMGKLLYETNSVFRDAFDECSKLFRPYLVKSITDLVYGEKADAKVIERTVYAQPLIFAIEYALYKMWENIGVKPEIVMGHSIGEYAAAVAAKIVTLEDAVKLVATRGRLMDMAPGHGKMATIFATAKTVTELLKGYEENVCIAARNAAETCVISGEAEYIEAVEEKASQAGYRVKELTVSHAFHSMLMDPILDDFYEIAKEVQYNPAQIRFVSAFYGKELEPGQILDADYWTKHIRKEVDFYKAISSIENKENYLFLEVGSNRVLAALSKLIFGDEQMIASTLSIKKEDKEYLPAEIAYVYATGVQIDWSRLSFAGKKNWKPQTLPNYPYDKKKYWMELQYDRNSSDMAVDDYHPILGQKIDVSAMDDTVIFQSRFTAKEPYFMREHIIYGAAISPAAAHSAMLISAVNEISNAKSCVLEKIEFRAPLAAKEEEQRQVQICMQKDGEQSKFNIASRDYDIRNDKWLLHAKGNVTMLDEYQFAEMKTDIAEYEKLDFDEDIEGGIYYFMNKSGFDLGEGFRRIKKISYGDHECVCCIEPLKTVPYFKDYILYPGTIDSIFQTGIALVLEELKESTNFDDGSDKTVIPFYMEKLTYNYRESDKLWCYTKSYMKNDITYVDIVVYNENGEVVMKIENLMVKITDSTSLLREMRNLNKLYFHNEWMPVEPFSKEETAKKAGTYILFSDEESAMQGFQEKMSASGVKPVCVLAGTGYEKKGDDFFVIRQGEKADWSQLLQDITGAGDKTAYQIIYCNVKDSVPKEAGAQMQYDAVKGLLYLIQVMNEEGYTRNSKIKIVTKDVQTNGSEKQKNLSGAMVWGLAKTASIEYPELFGGILDLDNVAINENASVIDEILCDEVQEICIHGIQRYVARLISHTEYLKKETDKKKKITVRGNASYLITGGTGALGTVYAKELIDEGAKNLVLLCRHEPGQKAKDIIRQFESEGVTVKLAYADVCNYESLKKALDEVAETMPPVRGVIHTAGVLNDKMMIDYDWDGFVKVLQPKVCGTMNLYQAVKENTLDFFIMLSSITSIIGNMGQANYAAANYFLNSFASFLNRNNVPGYTFCWGPWSESGMAAGKDAVSNTMERMGMKSFEREQGQKIIEDFFQQPYENLLIADVDWNTLGSSLKNAAGKTQFLSKVMSEKEDSAVSGIEEQGSAVADELKVLPKEERKEFLSDKLQEVCGKIMGFEKGQLSPDDAFREQGADSLMIFSMRTAINKLLGIDINVSAFFNYPSLTKLTEYILNDVLVMEEEMEEEEENTDSVDDILAEIAKLTE